MDLLQGAAARCYYEMQPCVSPVLSASLMMKLPSTWRMRERVENEFQTYLMLYGLQLNLS